MTELTPTQIEQRRMDVLARLDKEHPLAIFYELDTTENIIFQLNEKAEKVIRSGLAHPKLRRRETSALVTVKVAALTPDKQQAVYEITDFVFESMGTTDAVLSVERDYLQAGEIEVHTHLPQTPDYLGHTDVGDLIAAIEGPAWVHPTTKSMLPALRIYGILSIYPQRIARLQFYSHDLRDPLVASNNFGLKKLGVPVTLLNAF